MNTVVFVLMVMTHNGFSIPTIEFSTMAKCQAAIVAFDAQYLHKPKWNRPTSPHCIRFEK